MRQFIKNRIGHSLSLVFFIFSLTFSTSLLAQTDLVFIVDGSGSISSSDWSLQKEGIISALNDRNIIPTDGSISVAIVQFSDTAQLEFSSRVIDSQTDLNAAIAAVQNMIQIGATTGPGEGILTATAHMNTAARTTADQSFCLSTDGALNTGTSLSTAIADAKNSSFGLDQFSVIAIEDLPNFDENDAESEYGPHVFGGGTVFVVKNAIEFANTIGAMCLGKPVTLVGLEVIQTVQDLQNKIELIEDKETLVRAYLEPTSGSQDVVVTARLRGYRNGIQLSDSPHTAANAGTYKAKPDALAKRSELSESLNFELPDDWLNGTVTLELESASSIDCKEVAGPTANDCQAEVTFDAVNDFEVKLVRVKYTENNKEIKPPSTDDLTELENRLLAVFPISSIDRTSGIIDMQNGPPSMNDVLKRLKKMRSQDGCGFFCNRLYYGALAPIARYSDPWGGVASGSVSTGIIRNGDDYGRNRHAHELAHSLGRPHTVKFDLSNPLTKNGPCGSVAGLLAGTFPNFYMVGGNERATLGPMESGDQKLVFGWDSLRKKIIDPNKVFALMSYCTDARWISDHNHTKLKSKVKSRSSNASNIKAGAQSLDYLTVHGIINLDSNTVTFEPFSRLQTDQTPLQSPPGPFKLQAKDGSGIVLTEIGFAPELIEPDIIPGNPIPDQPNEGLFLIPVPYTPNIREITILNDASLEIGSIIASANAPVVNVIFPNGGESLNGNENLKWTASDTDGDSLSYIVQFSSDGGNTWDTLAVDYNGTSLDIHTDDLTKTTQGLIKVKASDGFNTTEDVSDGTFISPNSPPTCKIKQPFNQAEFASVQTINFRAFSNDVEDGKVTNISWSSDIDGNLGFGDSFFTTADTLSEGTHTITMTCQDSSGATDEDTVSIEINRIFSSGIAGDANGDGLVNSLDIITIINEILVIQSAAGNPDCTGDGSVNSLDLICTINIILEI